MENIENDHENQFCTGAATNDYCHNRLVGWLFFPLIGFINFLTKNTLLQILSNVFQTNVPTEWYTYST